MTKPTRTEMPTISDSSGIDADEEAAAAAAATSKAPGTGKDAMAGRGTSEHEEATRAGPTAPRHREALWGRP
ncbi:unnamed protein product [Lampetra fluviatilis]